MSIERGNGVSALSIDNLIHHNQLVNWQSSQLTSTLALLINWQHEPWCSRCQWNGMQPLSINNQQNENRVVHWHSSQLKTRMRHRVNWQTAKNGVLFLNWHGVHHFALNWQRTGWNIICQLIIFSMDNEKELCQSTKLIFLNGLSIDESAIQFFDRHSPVSSWILTLGPPCNNI